jgi:hypothetical protein
MNLPDLFLLYDDNIYVHMNIFFFDPPEAASYERLDGNDKLTEFIRLDDISTY